MKQLIIFVVLCLPLLYSCGAPQQQETDTAYKTLTIKSGDQILKTGYTATLRGRQNVEIRPQVSGIITEICINEGDAVHKGQTLFIIDQIPYKAALQTAIANVKSAEAKLATAKLTADSKAELYKEQVVSEFDLQTARNEQIAAEAALAQAKAQEVNARNDLSYTEVKSPVDGVASMLPYRVGALVSSSITTPLTTVSDDGEMAGSQFFDIDWPLLDAEGIVSATNSLGLERLAGISPQYLSMLTASVSYLAHSPLLPDKQRGQAESLYERLRRHVSPGQTPWLSLTGYELEPRSFSIVKRAINTDSLLDMEYSDGTGSTRRKLVAPAKIFIDEGVYYAAVYTDVGSAAPKDKKAYVSKDKTIDKANGKPRIWQVLRLARIEKAELVKPTKQINIPNMPVSELRKWSFDNGTDAVFITDQRDLAFIKTLPGATVEQCGAGEKVHLTVSSDSWFVAFCIAHARHITAVAPETLRTMIVARAERELSISENK